MVFLWRGIRHDDFVDAGGVDEGRGGGGEDAVSEEGVDFCRARVAEDLGC